MGPVGRNYFYLQYAFLHSTLFRTIALGATFSFGIASQLHAWDWSQQAGAATRDAFQTADHFQVAPGLNVSTLALTYTSCAATTNTLVVDENNAYWATGAGFVRAVQLSTGSLAWISDTAGVVNGEVKLPGGVWTAPVLAGPYLVVASEATPCAKLSETVSTRKFKL